MSDCWCHKCNRDVKVNGIPYSWTRMILCPKCGCKRCPHASDHELECTDSNDPGQKGSVYDDKIEPRVFKISMDDIPSVTDADWSQIKLAAKMNMSDKTYPEINDTSYVDLLVLAARAAGIPLEEFGDLENNEYWIDESGTWWNPLENDEDAFRLMVQLKLRINYDTVIEYDVVEVLGPERDDFSCDCTTYTIEDDQCAAVRRAIVHAAAKIGQRLVDNK